MVAIGTLFSAFWILSANSWMQTPAGYSINEAGQFVAADWWKVIFNPSFPIGSCTWCWRPISPRLSWSARSALGIC
jgi:cytochrome bd-type quinol oxidase subunit 1